MDSKALNIEDPKIEFEVQDIWVGLLTVDENIDIYSQTCYLYLQV
jgi:hypothetical protein